MLQDVVAVPLNVNTTLSFCAYPSITVHVVVGDCNGPLPPDGRVTIIGVYHIDSTTHKPCDIRCRNKMYAIAQDLTVDDDRAIRYRYSRT